MLTEQDGVATESHENPAIDNDDGIPTFADIADAVSVIDPSIVETNESTPDEVAEAQPADEVQNVENETTDEQTDLLAEAAEAEDDGTPQQSKGVQKRIEKLVARAHRAEAEREELKEQIANLEGQQAPVKVDAANPFSYIRDTAKLDEMVNAAEELQDWLTLNPDGGIYTDSTGQEHDFSSERARELQLKTRKDLQKHFPARKQQIANRQQFNQQAHKTFTWMNNEDSLEFTEAKKILRGDKNFADAYFNWEQGPLVLGFVIEGMKAMREKTRRAGAQPPVAPSTGTNPAPARANPQTHRSSGRDETLYQNAVSSGSRAAVSDYIESFLQ